ncbi:Lipopolysaccharide biosynthesis protein, LPS:glycosyltransferase [Butyrivibrio sp. ob235]|uniref:glycosyltransferase n=1 Tax=Butyrivibrio sp. ob235 TaxID=1761780 RepID=UPI0008C1F8D6|nr:glycosyltransferase [Butyrivibrio sp. ob235]SEL97571.1 Lipopolysaccharide biosynthesis protein, LPS:glycosyltransferase [Butyrivibrio sp. ob235]
MHDLWKKREGIASDMRVPIVMASDYNYLFPTCVTIVSLLENSSSDTLFCIYILVDPKNVGMDDGVFAAITAKYSNVTFYYLPIDLNFYKEVQLGNISSVASYYRLQIVSLLNEYDRCLFLDGDLVINCDITELFDIDMQDNYVAGVRDMGMQCGKSPFYTEHARRIGLKDLDSYVNAGVMVFNLKKLREADITPIWKSEIAKHYPIDDQDIINVSCDGRITLLPSKYNVFNSFLYSDDFISSSNYTENERNSLLRGDISIIHFASSKDKPWKNPYTVMADVWYSYLCHLPQNEWLNVKELDLDTVRKGFLLSDIRNECDKSSTVYIYGFTKSSFSFYDKLHKDAVSCFIDNDVNKQGKSYRGVVCNAPSFLLSNIRENDLIIVVAKKSDDAIIQFLLSNGINRGQIISFKEKDEQFYKSLDNSKYSIVLEDIYNEIDDSINLGNEDFAKYVSNVQFYMEKADLLKPYYFDLWINKSNPLISIIIPAYNSAKTINRCLKSISNQNYYNWECIIINDGSNDSTLEILNSWAKEDTRYKIISQDNKGMGYARNKGIEHACGEWITFVDSDDWIEYDYLYELLHNAIRSGADICRGNYYFVDYVKNNQLTNAGITDDIDIAEHNTYLNPNVWGSIYRKNIFDRTKIRMPQIVMEDLAVFPLLLLSANRVISISKPLYYYQINVGTSVMDNLENVRFLPEAVSYMLSEAKRLDIYDCQKKLFFDLVMDHYRGALEGRASKLSAEKYKEIEAMFKLSLEINFPEFFCDFSAWIFGSYNLCRIYSHCGKNQLVPFKLENENLKRYYGFSSISVITKQKERYVLDKNITDNLMRQDMIIKEKERSFWDINISKEEFLILDLLEERYDLLEFEEGDIVTKSETYNDFFSNYKIISCYERYISGQWRNDLSCFAKLLTKKILPNHIIMVENYLTPKYIDGDREGYWYDVTAINNILKEFYGFMKEIIPDMNVISLPMEYFYTDKRLKYGYAPSYMNESAYTELAQRISMLVNRIKHGSEYYQ